MEKILISNDKFGYCNLVICVTGMTWQESHTLAASAQNFWVKSDDDLLDVPGDWNIEDFKSLEAAEKHVAISDCGVAFYNGNTYCHCGEPECPRNDN